MEAVIELKGGGYEARFGIEDFTQFVDEWLEEHVGRTAAIWCVYDEFGKKWDPESEPFWVEGQTRRLWLYGPAGSGIIELPWTGEYWEALMEREYPKTYELLETFDVDDAEEGEGPVLDDEEASRLFEEGDE